MKYLSTTVRDHSTNYTFKQITAQTKAVLRQDIVFYLISQSVFSLWSHRPTAVKSKRRDTAPHSDSSRDPASSVFTRNGMHSRVLNLTPATRRTVPGL